MVRIRAGVLSQSQVLLAFGVVAELFNGVHDNPRESLAGEGGSSSRCCPSVTPGH